MVCCLLVTENYDNGDFHLLFLRIKCEQYAKGAIERKERIVIKEIWRMFSYEFKKASFLPFGAKLPYEILNIQDLSEMFTFLEDERLAKNICKAYTHSKICLFLGDKIPSIYS